MVVRFVVVLVLWVCPEDPLAHRLGAGGRASFAAIGAAGLGR